jgi:hypothetical protein
MQFLKIVLLCVLAAIFYGIVHDQITARICVEYFSVFHPPIFATQSPTLLALGWGIIGTWWVGAFLGVLLAIAARAGSSPKLSASDLIDPIASLLLLMAASAFIAGAAGYTLAIQGRLAPARWIVFHITPSRYPAFMADWWAHTASYAVGLTGGIILCVLQYRRRAHYQQAPSES